ncbi:hypothetical protein Taro_032845 [Colocasia esculenta]|uniref:Uncharacterized protein n=1 Tax=Colocasia esculenta TaxID=4460 RepID=A0A843VMB7_COLES|nr:hypothetical protein [Colocasia esculenta]
MLCSVGIFARPKKMLCAMLHRWLSAATPVCGCCRLCVGWLRTLVRCSQSSSMFGSGGSEVFPRTVLCSFLVVAALPSGLSCAGGTLCIPLVERFASFLVPCMLSQMVVW